MTRISARSSSLRRWLPLAAFAAMLVAMTVDDILSGAHPEAFEFDALAFVLLVAMSIYYFFFERSMVDEVLADYDNVVLRRGDVEVRLRYADIAAVQLERSWLVLHLERPSALGKLIRFAPAGGPFKNPFAPDPIEEELSARVAAARTSAARSAR